jgi:hypothetical protein
MNKRPKQKFAPMALTEPHGFTAQFQAETDLTAEAQRITAKVAKALQRKDTSDAEKLALARLVLKAIAAGPKSTARDIAVVALKVVA